MMRLTGRFTRKRTFEKSLKRIQSDFFNAGYNVVALEEKIENLANKLSSKFSNKLDASLTLDSENIGVVATTIYDVGGHTPLITRFLESFSDSYKMFFFLSDKKSYDEGIESSLRNKIQKLCKTLGVNSVDKIQLDDIVSLYNQIVNSRVSVLFIYIHPHDIILTVVFALLKKRTTIKFIFVNHADHVPVLGMKFMDLIIEARPAGLNLTKHERGYANIRMIDLQAIARRPEPIATLEEVNDIRARLGIPSASLVTLTGCAPLKLFDDESSSKYFLFIKELLESRKDLVHVLMAEFTDEQYAVIKKILGEDILGERLKIVERQSNYATFFKIADIFIDSFPQGSALTHIDCMRLKIPTVIKINRGDAFKSFEYYMPKNYLYAYKELRNMKKAIMDLLDDVSLRSETALENYNYCMSRYSFEVIKSQYEDVINKILGDENN